MRLTIFSLFFRFLFWLRLCRGPITLRRLIVRRTLAAQLAMGSIEQSAEVGQLAPSRLSESSFRTIAFMNESKSRPLLEIASDLPMKPCYPRPARRFNCDLLAR